MTCSHCGQEFNKEKSYVTRNLKKGVTTNFCNRTCHSRYLHWSYPQLRDNVIPGSVTDKFSPFRKYLASIRHRERDAKITLNDLKEQWDSQSGLCAISNMPMILPSTTGTKHKRTPNLASVDRIDSSKGYTIDNIQWVCLIAQYAKNSFSTDDVIEFCRSTIKKWGM